MAVKIAIIGCAETQDLAPWDDPTWIKWGLRQDNKYWPHFDAVFELHREDQWEDHGKLLERLENVEVPIYMRKDYGIRGSILYPYEAVGDLVGWYFTSSIAYMLGLAIYQGANEIGLWGIGTNDHEYAHQRPNLEYLMGFAKGRGITITLPEGCPFLTDPLYGY